MKALIFEYYSQMSDYIRKHGPLPTVRVGSRLIPPGRVTNVPAQTTRS
jgi:hypothetical protein